VRIRTSRDCLCSFVLNGTRSPQVEEDKIKRNWTAGRWQLKLRKVVRFSIVDFRQVGGRDAPTPQARRAVSDDWRCAANCQLVIAPPLQVPGTSFRQEILLAQVGPCATGIIRVTRSDSNVTSFSQFTPGEQPPSKETYKWCQALSLERQYVMNNAVHCNLQAPRWLINHGIEGNHKTSRLHSTVPV